MHRVTFAALVGPALLVAAARSSVPWSAPDVAETVRIRAHLDTVERELRSKDVAALTAAQRAARARNLEILHAYWVRGVFPKNTDFPGQRLPYFVDRYGTRCAMAHLIEQSGRGDLVARVATANNNARIRQLKNDPELARWLVENGITAAEAARIQPEYYGPPLATTPDAASVGYKTTTGVAVAANVLTSALNVAHTSVAPTLTGLLSIASGIAAVGAGAPNLDESGSRRTLGFVNTGVGAASALFGAYRLAHRPHPESRASVGPWVGPPARPGVTVSFAF